jgi:hypothetical protein
MEWAQRKYELHSRSYKNDYEFEIGSEVGTIDENLSSIKRDGGKVLD